MSSSSGGFGVFVPGKSSLIEKKKKKKVSEFRKQKKEKNVGIKKTKKRKKCRNLKLERFKSKITFSGASNFKNIILLPQLIFELERFEPQLVFQLFGL